LGQYGVLRLPTDPVGTQLKNKEEWNTHRSKESADFYTIGYAGRSIEDVLRALKSAGVATLIDIRHMPVSMYKPEFSKHNFRRDLEAKGFHYLHLPYLGIPRDIRSLAIGKTNRNDLWEWYDRNVVASFIGRNLHRFLNSADHPVALMCVETDPTACHRHRIVLALERLGLRGFDL
jgi:uncharacterized protein (DUF488 family)